MLSVLSAHVTDALIVLEIAITNPSSAKNVPCNMPTVDAFRPVTRTSDADDFAIKVKSPLIVISV